MTGPITDASKARPLDRLLHDPALRFATACWDGLRDKRLVPPRMALDPADLRPILQQSAILERPRPGTIRIRLGGARISALMGMEVRGLPLRALFDLADRGRITAEVEHALAEPALLLVDVEAPAPRFQPKAVARTQIMILPLSDREQSITRALYVMGDIEGEIDPAADIPQRWRIARRQRVPVQIGVDVLTLEEAEKTSARPAESSATDEDAAEARGPMARARFRVIDGGLA